MRPPLRASLAPSSLLSLVGVAVLSVSCSSGAAPVISSLTVTPMTATVGTEVTVTAMYAYSDSDDTVREALQRFTPPGGTETAHASALTTVAAEGTVTATLTFTPTAAGNHVVKYSVRDARGNESNVLTGTLVVTQ